MKSDEKLLPLVSVCCLTYNHKDTIAQALDGILKQRTNFPIEIIVHDDASNDGTTEIIKDYASRFPNIIHLILQTESQRSKCNLAQVFINPILKGKYVAICEGDDYWTDPYKLQRQVQYLVQHPDCSMCFHAVEQLERDGKFKHFHPLKHSGYVPPEVIIKNGGQFCPSVSLVFRRDVLECWPKFRVMADIYDFPAQVLAATMGKVYYMNRAMAVYRYASEGSWTAKQEKQLDFIHLQNEIKWMEEFDKYSGWKFSEAIHQHLSHYLVSMYRKTLQKKAWEMAREQVKCLRIPERAMYYNQYMLFLIGGKAFRWFWFTMKKIIRRDQV